MLLKNSKIVLLIVAIICCLALHTAAALVQRSRISRVMQLPEQSESATVATTTVNATIGAKEENDAAKEDDDDDDENDNIALKTELQTDTATTSLSIWGAVRGLWSLLRDGLSESFLERSNAVASRTFGKIRRLQMALIPIIFKFGILTAMVSFLVLLGIKTIFLLKLILLLNVVGLLAKFFTLKLNLGHHSPEPAWGHNNFNYEPISHSGWSSSDHIVEPPAPSKEIHLHIHGGQLQPQGYSQQASYGSLSQGSQGWERRSDPYAEYAPSSPTKTVQSHEQLNNSGPLQYLPVHYEASHRQF